MRLIQHRRVRLSQICSLFFFIFFAVTEKKIEAFSHILAEGMFSVGCFLVGIAVVGRLWCALYISGYKTNTLITKGPYSICRNPLYFFSFVGALGIASCTKSLVLAGIVITIFILYYSLIIRTEEYDMLEIFKNNYKHYFTSVPRFVPKFSLLNEPDIYSTRPKYFRREVFNAFWFVVVIGLLKFIETLSHEGIIHHYFSIY